ncbi:hypothetical protein CCAX7_10830 [Capsulimonas corticalis]|uniref:Uncharacterized protein n=1 Tax=Capsulimonas corticalis TaxID=2219043 RepID=A0A402CUM8_9BACT|nr:PEP-CTERM sorting domain-containing protein [Capsulimonas corticalis]BDI29032.1 hypothetical protein CCAX7_10830 [Capsulimonas corticalis]
MKQVFPGSFGRFLAPFAAALGLAVFPSPAGAANLTFHQADWLSDFTGFTSQNSDWGQVDIHLTSSDLSALQYDPSSSTYTGYINVVTNVQDGATMNWAVQNLPVQFQGLSSFNGSLPDSVMFDLGVTPGMDVTQLGYYATINMDPLGLAPTGSFATAGVDNLSLLYGGVDGTDPDTGTTFLGGTGRDAPPKAENFKGANAGETQGKGGQIAGKETDVAAVDEDKMGCVPGATARSIKYLQSQHKNVNTPDSAQDVYNALKTTMQSSVGDGGNGTNVDNLKPGKDAYDKAKKLPIKTEKNGGIANAIAALNKKKDVEVILKSKGQGGHCAFVSKIIPTLDKKGRVVSYTISTIDDPTQGNHKAENRKADYTVKPNGDITSPGNFAKVDTYFIETAVPEPSSSAALFAGFVSLVFFAGRRRSSLTA